MVGAAKQQIKVGAVTDILVPFQLFQATSPTDAPKHFVNPVPERTHTGR